MVAKIHLQVYLKYENSVRLNNTVDSNWKKRMLRLWIYQPLESVLRVLYIARPWRKVKKIIVLLVLFWPACAERVQVVIGSACMMVPMQTLRDKRRERLLQQYVEEREIKIHEQEHDGWRDRESEKNTKNFRSGAKKTDCGDMGAFAKDWEGNKFTKLGQGGNICTYRRQIKMTFEEEYEAR